MFGILLYDIIFFAIPAIFIALFVISLYRYVSAKKKNKDVPGTFTDAEIKKRKIMMMVFAVIAGVLAAIVIGFLALLFMVLAFM